MSMEEGLDTGPVIEQESTVINDSDNLEILTKRLSKISSKLLLKSLNKIKQTKRLNKSTRLEKLNAIDQSKLKGNPSYARQLKKSDFLIDWDQNARKIIKKIHALYPNAYTVHKGKRIKILEVSSLDNKLQSIEYQQTYNHSTNDKFPGEILMINQKHGIQIMTKDYPIQIKCGQLEGKKATAGYTLSVQSKLSINDILKD